MLLRLIPAPTSSIPTPPTILFTLPLPTEPYTSSQLPLPPALVAARDEAQREKIPFASPLNAESSSWISSIIQEVTFDARAEEATLILVDGEELYVKLRSEAQVAMQNVLAEVVAASAPSPTGSARSTRRDAEWSPRTERGPSPTPSFLKSLFAPLMSPPLSSTPPTPTTAQSIARAHRKMARSLLVDAYRQYVLVALKELLPANYLTWAIQSQLRLAQRNLDHSHTDIQYLLRHAGIPHSLERKLSSSSLASSFAGSASSSTSDISLTSASSLSSIRRCYLSSSTSSPSPPTSPLPILTLNENESFSLCPSSPSSSSAPHEPAYPPASSLAISQRGTYNKRISEMTSLTTRVAHLKKLLVRVDKEASRRMWADKIDDDKIADRACRRAWSGGRGTGDVLRDAIVWSKPLVSSRLAQVSYTAKQQERKVIVTVTDAGFPSVYFEFPSNRPPPLSPSSSSSSFNSLSSSEDEGLLSDGEASDDDGTAVEMLPALLWQPNNLVVPEGIKLILPDTKEVIEEKKRRKAIAQEKSRQLDLQKPDLVALFGALGEMEGLC